jgi:hypothetical protein
MKEALARFAGGRARPKETQTGGRKSRAKESSGGWVLRPATEARQSRHREPRELETRTLWAGTEGGRRKMTLAGGTKNKWQIENEILEAVKISAGKDEQQTDTRNRSKPKNEIAWGLNLNTDARRRKNGLSRKLGGEPGRKTRARELRDHASAKLTNTTTKRSGRNQDETKIAGTPGSSKNGRTRKIDTSLNGRLNKI